MKTISLSVSEVEYQAFQRAAKQKNRSVAQLIREAMTYYREKSLEAKTPLTELPLLPGHRQVKELPARDEVYDEMFAGRSA